jgi:apolipoprotein N-acyltransferase
MQHMSIALFRALENKRTLVRSTNGGITCVIDPNGRITAMLDPFTEDYLIAEAPIYAGEQTLYTRWGDWFAVLVLSVALAGVAGGLLYRLLRN